MAWGAESQITTALALASTIAYGNPSTTVALNVGESAEVQISAAFTGTATADLYLRVVASNDGVRWDTLTYMSGMSIGRVVSTTQTRTIMVRGVKNFRIEYAQSVSDAQAITVNAWAQKDGINI